MENNDQLEQRFHHAMLGIYEAVKNLDPPYHPTYFLQMVNQYSGKEAADRLLATTEPSQGFTELFLRGRRLDLSVEHLVLQNPWRDLFTPEQLAVARQRLSEYGFEPPEQ
jgi:hypothetical protein